MSQDELVLLLDEAFDGPAWHGPALMQALRGVTQTLAARRPAPARHNIWEIALHDVYHAGQIQRLKAKG